MRLDQLTLLSVVLVSGLAVCACGGSTSDGDNNGNGDAGNNGNGDAGKGPRNNNFRPLGATLTS